MRTPEEILARLTYLLDAEEDFLGFQGSDLLRYLPYEQARPYLKDGVTAERWEQETKKTKEPADLIREYLPFAWEKANDCRGLSAMRSLDHFAAWLWLLGDDDTAWLSEHTFYGKPHLVAISERFGFPWQEHDNGKWRNDERQEGITAAQALGRPELAK